MREVRWSTKQRVAVSTATLGVYGLVKLPSLEGMGSAETRVFGQGDERIERKTNIGGIEPNEPATLVGMSKVAVRTDTASPEAGAQVRRRLSLGAGWRFARHLLEMMAAMLVPMFTVVLPVELGVVGLTGHALMVISYVAMIGGMVALMIYRCLALA